ncbi:hypothetical protein BU24DRAFT_462892 [Aaosphaeria arxii CBS 175.79]|uniref:Uncharacterized protein n=1 Tax=Aaosphaeria arxii CBS 175.79 TaxID=1450172 RepID=A0A6A5XUY8_9PLEO|nr:uncharacterized protein BU24DRAFT_462892 [Aaosphaeria arxii CBS 175.79]KAF2016773.1 hypothetical protein BU24DRAFT_462892 [Aaosphaeria arxii CBS 175.79]
MQFTLLAIFAATTLASPMMPSKPGSAAPRRPVVFEDVSEYAAKGPSHELKCHVNNGIVTLGSNTEFDCKTRLFCNGGALSWKLPEGDVVDRQGEMAKFMPCAGVCKCLPAEEKTMKAMKEKKVAA